MASRRVVKKHLLNIADMAIDTLQTLDIIEVMENFLGRRRPPEDIRPQVDIGYKIQGQSIIIHEIRPLWNNLREKIEEGVAKATFVKKDNSWKVYWMPGDLKWRSYAPCPVIPDLKTFVRLVEEDEYHCFWG